MGREIFFSKSDHVIKDGFCLFWKSWLSNWTESLMLIDSVLYNCVEQYMMAMKARLFGDTESLKSIMSTSIPEEQKDYGRSVANFQEQKWNDVALEVVTRGTVEKYRQNPKLLIKLQQLGDVEFVEASPIDKIWGIGLAADHPDATNKSKWPGLNLLGQAIGAAKYTIELCEMSGISVGGGIDLVWRPDTAGKFIIDLDKVD